VCSRAYKALDPNAIIQPSTRRRDRPSKPNGLIKQTYSVSVHLPGLLLNKKWHVVAYFTVCTFKKIFKLVKVSEMKE
jgi:hypothetical protein